MSTKKAIKLMLVENVDNLGIVGDVVDVRAGYARNFLLPHGLAVPPTEGARKAVEERRKQVEQELAAQRAQQEAIIAKLEELEVTLKRSANEDGLLYGSVTQHDIVVALAEQEGIELNERHIRIGAPIKHLDSYMIPVQLDKELKAEFKLWVVSDKPAEELMAQELSDEQADESVSEPEAGLESRLVQTPDDES